MTPRADAARRRVTPAQRLDEVVDAASRVFAAKGYRRTQMSDVARELGVSAGNLYNYVPGKETLFALVLRRGAEGTAAAAAVSLPVAPITLDEAVISLTERLDFVSDFPALEAALAGGAPASASAAAAEARAVVLELYDQLDRVGRLIVVIEASGPDVPEVATFFLGLRREAFARMARYVESRTRAGAFRPLEDPAVTARLILELVNWSAVRHPHRNDPESLPADAARRAVADIAVHALVGR
jgi:AcrR family transcriptional regulator